MKENNLLQDRAWIEIDFNNVWDKLEYYKEKYGNEFILIPLS